VILVVSGVSIATVVVMTRHAPPKFEVTNLTLNPTEAKIGQTVTVSANVKNIGEAKGTYTAVLSIDGAEKDTRDITIAGGETKTVTFLVVKNAKGTYTIGIGELNQSLEIKENENVKPEENTPSENTPEGYISKDTKLEITDGTLIRDKGTGNPYFCLIGVVWGQENVMDRQVLESLMNADSYRRRLVMASLEEISAAGWGIWGGMQQEIVLEVYVTQNGDASWVTNSAITIMKNPNIEYYVCDENARWVSLGPYTHNGCLSMPQPLPVNIITTEKPASFKVSNLIISPTEVTVGSSVTVTVTVLNEGDKQGTYTVTLNINGATEDTKNITLSGGATGTLSFTITKNVAQTYNVSVDGLNGTFSVSQSTPTEPLEINVDLTDSGSTFRVEVTCNRSVKGTIYFYYPTGAKPPDFQASEALMFKYDSEGTDFGGTWSYSNLMSSGFKLQVRVEDGNGNIVWWPSKDDFYLL